MEPERKREKEKRERERDTKARKDLYVKKAPALVAIWAEVSFF